MYDDFYWKVILTMILIMLGFGIYIALNNEMEEYPQRAKSYYEEQFISAGDILIINKYTDDFKADIIKYGESKGYKLRETKIENNYFTDDTTLIFEKIK
ncbi:hypothetical protein ACO1GV_01650 [Fusobacterium watanabei]|uniref:hypothetical protein n=1 Tax=Fusobacterium TaxID=848 RepID=UPI0030D4C52C